MVRYENGDKDFFEEEPLFNAMGEVRPGMRYREYKKLYSPQLYVHDANDAYSPFWSGLASFFIPGLGQGVCGEWGRGLCFLAGDIGLLTLMETGVIVGAQVDDPSVPYGITLGAMAGILALDIWSICDATKVAKIKNMYYQDIRSQRALFDIKLTPFLASSQTTINGGYHTAAGVSLKVVF